jgi:hypothetical protein
MRSAPHSQEHSATARGEPALSERLTRRPDRQAGAARVRVPAALRAGPGSALRGRSAAKGRRGTVTVLAGMTGRGLRGYRISVDMTAPEWMHSQITAAEYESCSEEQCAGIEIVDGMVVVSPSAPKRHNRLARILANALDAAGGADWNGDADFDVRLQDVPLTNRRPDVVVYRADGIDITPTRPEHVLLAVEIVSPGSETTDRVVKLDQYARSGIPLLLARGIDRDGHPGRLFLPARLGERAVPGRRGIHRADQNHRALPRRDRPVGSLVTAKATLISGAGLPPRTARPVPGLEPGAPAPRPARVRALLVLDMTRQQGCHDLSQVGKKHVDR